MRMREREKALVCSGERERGEKVKQQQNQLTQNEKSCFNEKELILLEALLLL